MINHEGQIDNGHYTSFARFQDTVRHFISPPLPRLTPAPAQWCRFDDDKVTPATLAGVLGASAPIYMAFYVKRRLDYKPHTTPSYILTREIEAVREREREREALAAKARADQQQEQQDAQAQARERERENEVDSELLAMVEPE